jgi:inositol oxygenase
MKKKYCQNFGKLKMNIWEAIDKTNGIIDESDPDTDLPQIVHSFQVAERLRSGFPDVEWLPLVGLIHDLGKVLSLPEFGNEPQWCVVGDTFPVGCAFDSKIVYSSLFSENPDINHPVYSTENGIYEPNCGFKNVHFSFGHDEYLYQVLKHNKTTIPEEGLRIVRFHSFYAWHTERKYLHLMDQEDQDCWNWVKKFQECDLYSKDAFVPDIDDLREYYSRLISKYFPNEELEW